MSTKNRYSNLANKIALKYVGREAVDEINLDSLTILTEIQTKCQKIMLERGYPNYQVLEPWRF